MKKKLRLVVVALALVLGLTTGLLAGCADPSKGTIAVVAKGESHAFWLSVKSGAEAAAKKYGYDTTFRGPASESAKDLASQKEMVTTALTNNPKALVLATIGEGFVELLTQAKDKNIPVVQFDSGIWKADVEALNAKNKNPIVSSVATSNVKAAATAAENFFNSIKADMAKKTAADKYKLGIIQHDETTTGIDRSNGFKTKIEEMIAADTTTAGKVEILLQVKPGDADNNYKLALQSLFDSGVSAVFMTNEGVVKQVSDEIGATGTKYNDVKFCGFDAGTKQIDWMKKGTDAKAAIYGSVAQDSYNIGYKAVEQAIFAIEKQTVSAKVEIGGEWWHAGNVDDMIAKNIVYKG